jgi:hypothetical protein
LSLGPNELDSVPPLTPPQPGPAELAAPEIPSPTLVEANEVGSAEPAPDAGDGKTEDGGVSSLIFNENEAEPTPTPPLAAFAEPLMHAPISPSGKATIDRFLKQGGPLAEWAKRSMARIGVKDPNATRTVSVGIGKAVGKVIGLADPKPVERMSRGELKLRSALVIGGPGGGDPDTILVLSRLGPGCDPGIVDAGVRRLCREFKRTDCQDFEAAYAQVLNEVRMGALATEAVVHAYRRASGPKVRNRGAAFAAALQKWTPDEAE